MWEPPANDSESGFNFSIRSYTGETVAVICYVKCESFSLEALVGAFEAPPANFFYRAADLKSREH